MRVVLQAEKNDIQVDPSSLVSDEDVEKYGKAAIAIVSASGNDVSENIHGVLLCLVCCMDALLSQKSHSIWSLLLPLFLRVQ